MAYTTIDKPSDYFNTVLWTGNDTDDRTISGVGFSPNWAWIKARNNADAHYLVDTVRGSTKVIFSNSNSAEDTRVSAVKSFASDGYVLGQEAQVNRNSGTFVAWNWLAETSFTNDASSTSIGSIDSAGSFNNDAGFSICSFTGNGTSGASVKHGLSTKPAMMIIKNRDEADSWQVYHHKNTSAPATETLQLNETGATVDTANRWNDTEPTTAILTLGDNPTVNKSGIKYIVYIFSEKQGYSKFGSYVGNGNADGTFVYLGFKPAFFLVKRSDSTTSWTLLDNKRDPFNVTTERLFPNENVAGSVGTNANTDFLSNGVKIRVNHNNFNNSGGSYIYMAFAENPFVTSTGVPATAR